MLRRVVGLSVAWGVSLCVGLTRLAAADVPEKSDAPATKKPADAATNEKAAEQKFLRVVRDAKGVPVALDTAVVRYVGVDGKNKGATVDLIGAVHIGEASYYAALNKRFASYEALLYELVAPKGTKIPKGGQGRSSHPLGMLQQGMTEILGLAYQLEEVDYTKKNFVHADMSPEEFASKMEEKGESWFTMFFRMMGQGIAMQAKNGGNYSELEMMAAFFDRNRELKLKRVLAKQFEEMETVMDAFEGEDGSTIITERNKAALKVLGDELGKGKRTIGIFYGAGHLADMDRRLLAEFGLTRQKTEWLTAWKMNDPPAAKQGPRKQRAAEKKAAAAAN